MTAAERAIAAARAQGVTIAVAESLTGGAVTSALVSVPGASAVLHGGVVAYATPVKHTVLGVDAALLAAHGAVHPEVARQMARGIRRALAVDAAEATLGVSTTGIAGPDSPDGQPVGTVYVGVSLGEASEAFAYAFDGDRAAIRQQATDAALAALCRALGVTE